MHGGAKSKVVTISLSPQGGAYTREVIIPAIPVGGEQWLQMTGALSLSVTK